MTYPISCMNITCYFVQAVCLAACKKLHEMNAFTDMLLPDRGSGEGEKTEQNEGDPLPGTARHREFYPEGVAEILRVSYFCFLAHYLSAYKQELVWTLHLHSVARPEIILQSHSDGYFFL